MPSLSVIIPAYNEEKRLPRTLHAVREYLQEQSYAYEVIVVNAGSSDRTEAVVRSLMQSMPALKILSTENRGKGYAVKRGMLKAKGELRIFMDADNSTTINHFEKMLSEFQKGYAVVVGSRDIPGAQIPIRQPWRREILGKIFHMIVQIFSGLGGIRDTQCGFKGFTQNAVEDIFPRTTVDQWAFDVELLVLAKRRGHKVKEIPITWINDPASKLRLGGMCVMLLDVLRIRMNIVKGLYD